MWKYDKRPRNGSQFVYFGMYPVNPVSAIAQSLIQYTRCAITALKITNGATHTEVMMTSEGPCLVEVRSPLLSQPPSRPRSLAFPPPSLGQLPRARPERAVAPARLGPHRQLQPVHGLR